MEGMNIHNVSYKGLDITLTVKRKVYVQTDYNNEELNIVTVRAKRNNGNSIFLGDFFIKLPKVIEDNDLDALAKQLINNIDSIIFDNSRYVGTVENGTVTSDDDVRRKIEEKFHNHQNEELGKIYSEFLELDKHSKEHEKYCKFLELYFFSQSIPDSIKGIYLSRKRHSILSYEDLDYEIKREFSGQYQYAGDMNYQSNLELLAKLEPEIRSVYQEIMVIEPLLDEIALLITKTDRMNALTLELAALEERLKNMGFFEKGKRDLKEKITVLKNKLEGFSIDTGRKLLRQKIKESYVSRYEGEGLLDMFDDESLENFESVFRKVYDIKTDSHNKLVARYNRTYEEVEEYESNQVDMSDLYQRIDEGSRKQK